MQGASFKTQANALLRKSAIYQKRNIGTNCCLLSAPIFFCLLLLLIRILVNTLFLSGPNFEVRHASLAYFSAHAMTGLVQEGACWAAPHGPQLELTCHTSLLGGKVGLQCTGRALRRGMHVCMATAAGPGPRV